MANWKKVIVSGSIAELAQLTASTGINIPSLNIGENTNFVLTVGDSGSIEKRDPKTIGAAFQSMSVAGPIGLGDFGTDTFIAEPGLNELIFISGSNVQIETSHSYIDDNSESVGYIKISATTASVEGATHKTRITRDGVLSSSYVVHTAQAISTGSNVTFGTISGSKLTVTSTASDLAVFEGSANKANIKIKDEDTTVYVAVENDRASIGASATPSNNNLNINLTDAIEGLKGNVGIGTKHAPEKLTVRGNISASGNITASGDLFAGGDGRFGGNLSVDGGSVFGLNGFAITIDDVSVLSGSTNFGSGSHVPSAVTHKFTGSLFVTGSGITLVDGIYTGDAEGLTNLQADELQDLHNLSWGYGFTQSFGQSSSYSPTGSVHLHMHLSGSEITSSIGGLYIPGRRIRLDHLVTGSTGGLISYASGTNVPYVIPIGTKGQVLTVTGTDTGHHTASFQNLPPTLAMGIHTGSIDYATGFNADGITGSNFINLVLTSSNNNGTEVVSQVTFSGSRHQITVSGSYINGTNDVRIRLADNIKNVTSIHATNITASALQIDGNITASGDLFVGGDLMVAGDTTMLHTANLLVEDAFITLASGSADVDGGIIVQTGPTTGKGFGWDTTTGRWGLQNNLVFNTTNLTPLEFIVSTKLSDENPGISTTPSYGQVATKKQSGGQMWVNTGSGDIWIYVD